MKRKSWKVWVTVSDGELIGCGTDKPGRPAFPWIHNHRAVVRLTPKPKRRKSR